MSEPFIICDNLVKIYKVEELEVVALQGLDLVLAPGELLGIVGASGSGKSTLMNILGGLDSPSAGRVWVDKYDLLKMTPAALDRFRRSTVGFVWQQVARNLIPYLTALENVELPMTLSGSGGRKRDRAESLLTLVGLDERQGHRLSELSGGEQQRVAIAVALANEPKLLLADEPTGEVDEATAMDLYRLFRHLNQSLGLTIIIVSHDPGLARHVDRVVAIRDGKTAAETVRQNSSSVAGGSPDGGHAHDEAVYEELTVLDSAGRLQVPKEFLRHFGIKRRVRLELVDEGILIKPALDADSGEDAEALASRRSSQKKSRGVFGRQRSGKKR